MSHNSNFELICDKGAPIKAWVKGVFFEEQARQQVLNVATLPIIYKWIAVMPDVHMGKGATIGSVIPTVKAIIPAAVGVDLGCGLIASRLNLTAAQLPENLKEIRTAIEKAVPVGRTHHGNARRDQGAWHSIPPMVAAEWKKLEPGFKAIVAKHPAIADSNNVNHLGTLGTGNHFIELCLDENNQVWIMLHSGSRGVGNKIGTYFINLARKDMGRQLSNLPDKDLAYLKEGSQHFDDYVAAVQWAQEYALVNRRIMAQRVVDAIRSVLPIPIEVTEEAVNCHHNYVQQELHYNKQVWITRKGAISARKGELGIIPGSMGASSFIVRGLGNPESFNSCSHGAGRVMSRTQARKTFTVEDQIRDTAGVECRKDAEVVDEHPKAYKPIMSVLDAQNDLVEIVHSLHQLVCVKG
ncbi:RtcB family protein [uncultured Photobacterium sp.]|uniref:RtcB family protein n=1 Tax=uncultured Photobacterium sp. TaxID=173973 RepID=UPI00261DFC9E|nr:RtcB family protein [uncultured Photobacterium sp.]